MNETYKGDSILSGYQAHLWKLQQHILLKYGCYTIFKYDMVNVPTKTRGLLQWYVPAHNIRAREIRDYIEKELESEKREDTQIEDVFFPGQDVEVTIAVELFSGLEPYIKSKDFKRISLHYSQELFKKLSKSEEIPKAQKIQFSLSNKIIKWWLRLSDRIKENS